MEKSPQTFLAQIGSVSTHKFENLKSFYPIILLFSNIWAQVSGSMSALSFSTNVVFFSSFLFDEHSILRQTILYADKSCS